MINKEEVIHISKLARLELTEKEIEKMQKDLSSILDYFDIIKKVKTDEGKGESKKAKKLNNKNILRKDEAVPKSLSFSNNLIAISPGKKENYIKVKQIL